MFKIPAILFPITCHSTFLQNCMNIFPFVQKLFTWFLIHINSVCKSFHFVFMSLKLWELMVVIEYSSLWMSARWMYWLLWWRIVLRTVSEIQFILWHCCRNKLIIQSIIVDGSSRYFLELPVESFNPYF